MLEILIFGLALVVAYLIAHEVVMRIERRRGRPLGMWRVVWFFLTFLVLVLVAQSLVPRIVGVGDGGPA